MMNVNESSAATTASPPSAPPTPSPASTSAAGSSVQTAVRQQLQETGAELKEGAIEAVDTAKEAACSLLEEQRGKIADTLANYGSALQAAGDRLAEDGENPLVQPARRAARQLDKASAYLRDKSRADLIRDLSSLARSHPEWVFGGLFVAGLAAARFLKASAPEGPVPRHPVVPRPMPAPAAMLPATPPTPATGLASAPASPL